MKRRQPGVREYAIAAVLLIGGWTAGCTARPDTPLPTSPPQAGEVTGSGRDTPAPAPAAKPDESATARASQPGMPCSQATRVAREALIKMGYLIEKVEPAKPGVPGRVAGTKNAGWNASDPKAGTAYAAQITVTCSDRGADFEGRTDEGFLARMSFRQEFAKTIAALSERKVTRPRVDDRPETGLLISVEPLRGPDATAEFGVDVTASGVTPVRVRIDNKTERTYQFAGEGVRLVSQDGARSSALDPQQAAAKLPATVGKSLQDKLIGDGEIAPGATRAGFLYFPAAAYRRATLLLVDRATEESEGFRVEF